MILSNPSSTIERATPDHVAAISTIGRTSFTDAFEHLFESKEVLKQYLDHTYSHEKLISSITKPNNALFVAVVSGIAVGFAKMKKQSPNIQIAATKQCELQKIYVLKEFHGTGVAAALLKAVVAETEKNAHHLWLDVHISNEKAKRFYLKNNFNRIGDHEFIIGTQSFKYDVMAMQLF
jgi:ribosomal protein S18 acetylase RimI-like enzyme